MGVPFLLSPFGGFRYDLYAMLNRGNEQIAQAVAIKKIIVIKIDE